MPPGEIRFDTRAVDTINEEAEGIYHRVLVPAEALRAGRNVVAVEAHQVNRTSTDLVFDLRMTALGLAAEKIPGADELDRLETALDISTDVRAILWTARARLLQDVGLAERAEEARQRLLSFDQEDPAAWWLAARAAVQTDDLEAAYLHYRRALTAAVALAQQSGPARRLFLPPGLAHFGRIADDSPLTIARAGVLRADSADAERGWELLLLNRWLAERAPEDPDVRKQRAAFLAPAGEFAQAEELVDGLLSAYQDGAALDPLGIRKHKELLALRETILRGMGRRQDADGVRREIFAIPPRRPDSGPKQLDLTQYYNASLYDGRDWDNNADLHLSLLPETFELHEGIAFDIRGIIQLSGTNMPAALPYPQRVAGIPVDAETESIHFLLAACRAFDRVPGVELGRVVFRYADGSTETLRLIDQQNIADYWAYSYQTIDPALIAWKGANTQPGRNEPFQLFHIAWRNSHPERRIATLDLESAMASSAPFVVAITRD